MSKPAVLFLSSNYAPALSMLEEHFEVYNYRDAADRPALLREAAPRVRAVFSNEAAWSHSIMDALPNLQMIALTSAGYDAINLTVAKARGIQITNTPTQTTGDVADMAITLLLATARRLTWAERYVRSGAWLQEGRAPLTRRFYGKKLGIVGLGSIGRALARRAAGFDMDLSYHGPRAKTDVAYRYYASLIDMARDCDFIAVTCSGGPKTAGIISAEVIAALGPDGILVNVARGSCVDQPALLAALKEKRLGGAGLDVFASEPAEPDAFAGLENVVLTPHYASGTPDTRREMNELGIANLRAFFADKPLLTPVSL